MRYGGIGEHTFDIGLHDGGKVADQQRGGGKQGKHQRPVMMHYSQPGNEDAESENDGGDFRGSADQGGNRSGRAVIRRASTYGTVCAEFERNGDDDKHQTQFQQPFVSFFIEGRGEHA